MREFSVVFPSGNLFGGWFLLVTPWTLLLCQALYLTQVLDLLTAPFLSPRAVFTITPHRREQFRAAHHLTWLCKLQVSGFTRRWELLCLPRLYCEEEGMVFAHWNGGNRRYSDSVWGSCPWEANISHLESTQHMGPYQLSTFLLFPELLTLFMSESTPQGEALRLLETAM